MRIRLVYRPGHPLANSNGMVDISEAGLPQSDPATYVISDTMDHTRHMADGQYYDSKSKYRKVTKAYGCVEVGNETATLLKPRKKIELSRADRREAIRRAIRQLT